MTPAADLRLTRTGGFASMILALALLVACGDDNGAVKATQTAERSQRIEPAEGAEPPTGGQVPALVSESDVLASAELRISKHPDDEVDGIAYFLGEGGDSRPTIQIGLDDDQFDGTPTHELDDGRPAEVTTGGHRPSRFVAAPAPGGGRLTVWTFDLDLTEGDLLTIASAFDPDRADEPIAGWELIGEVPMPAYLDGYTSSYTMESELFVSIGVDRLEGDEMLMYGFGPVEPDEIGGFPAWRLDRTAGTLPGFVFTLDDAYLVRLEGNPGMSDDELRDIAEQIRPATPEELRKGLEQGRSASTDDP